MDILLSVRNDPKFNGIDTETKIKYLNTKFKQIQTYINYIEFCDWDIDKKITSL